MQIEVKCSKKCFKIFLPQKAGAFGNNIVKEPQKPLRKLKKHLLKMKINKLFIYYKLNII